MKLCVVGTGYVGLVTGVCFAEGGNDVWCVDVDAEKVKRLKQGEVPIYEPGLHELLLRTHQEKRLHFTTQLEEGLKQAEVCFICVDTPTNTQGEADLSKVYRVASDIGQLQDHAMVVVTKSTVPVGTTYKVRDIISEALSRRGKEPKTLLNVASNPEFLKEGNAVQDFMKPDRVVVGVDYPEVGATLRRLYKPFMQMYDGFMVMDVASSELTKYAANAMLATRISFMNSLARLAEGVGANILKVQEALGRDPRVGPYFLHSGLGYGGSCFPKDMEALLALGKQYQVPLPIIEAADEVNRTQLNWFLEKMVTHFGGEKGIHGKKIAVWGVAFKPETDDIRRAPALFFIQQLVERGVKISAYDPIALPRAQAALGASVEWKANAYEVLNDADALLLCTEWQEFGSPDFDRMLSLMKTPTLFDGRNVYEADYVKQMGFTYYGVGVSS